MSENAKENILNAAEKEFSSKGFDGARVDKIAQVAGVNKALIYYYFKSKKELLKALYERLVQGGFKSFDLMALAGSETDEDEEAKHLALHRILDFLENHRDIIRIIFMESLKGGEQNMLLDLADFYMNLSGEDFFESVEDLDKRQFVITEIFTALMPLISFTLLKDDVSQRMSITTEQIDHYFMNSMKETHFQSHRQLKK